MAFDSTLLSAGFFSAAADLTAKQFRFVQIGASLTINVPSTQGAYCFGVLQDTPSLGQAGDVAFAGFSKITYGNTITAGQILMSDNQGRAIPYDGAETSNPLGQAVVSGSVGDIGIMQIMPSPVLNTADTFSAYIVANGKYSNAGGGATATIPITGLLATDEVFAQIQSSTNAVTVEKVTPSTGSLAVLMSGDPGVSVISYIVVRTAT